MKAATINYNGINGEINKGEEIWSPENNLVSNWAFDETEKDEARLANFMAIVAQKNGISKNEMLNIYPMVLRMLKSKSLWAD
jgi:hypothetical protein